MEVQSCKVEILAPFLCMLTFLKEASSLWLCKASDSHSQRGNINLFQVRDECSY